VTFGLSDLRIIEPSDYRAATNQPMPIVKWPIPIIGW